MKQELDKKRHSLAHLMAQSIQNIFGSENVQFGIGPTIENGFYYDIDLEHKIIDEDLKKIEKEMKSLIKKKQEISRVVMSRDDAIEFFTKKNQLLKVELISSIPQDEEISCYQQGDFIDLCRGPHVENTKELPFSFKLIKVAGAYWRGNSDNKMLQRIYAVAFNTKEELKAHLTFLQEAKKSDHRVLGKDLNLFTFHPMSPGSPFFMPKGTFIYNELVNFMRRIYNFYGYSEVITPQILDSELWKTSGHYDHYKENMFFSKIDEREYAVKPMNCPCHMLMFKSNHYSYRDLPLRFADFGRIHRYEKAGSLAGLTRVRTFCQDDAHVFLPLDKIQEEIKQLMEMFYIVYDHFGFTDVKAKLSTRPDNKAGDDATWDIAENSLKKALEASGKIFEINEGDGAFYGPKIDLEVADALGRRHQLGTIQLDFQLPERFELNFINKSGEQEQPVVVHRALLGSLERFFGLFIEHTKGAFPFWIAPVQTKIVPVNNEQHLDYAKKIKKEMAALGIRVEIDDRNESMGYKTREIQKEKVPFMIVIGDKEIEDSTLSVREYGSKFATTITHDEVINKFKDLNLENLPKVLRDRI